LDDLAIGQGSGTVFVGHALSSEVAAAGSSDVEIPVFLVVGSSGEEGVEAVGEVIVISRGEIGGAYEELIDDVGAEESQGSFVTHVADTMDYFVPVVPLGPCESVGSL
jgi:hypothetical protein